MIIAWQNPLDESIAPAVLVTFGKIRRSLSVTILETDAGYSVEARVGRKLVERVRVGHDRNRLADGVEITVRAAVGEMLAGLR